MRTDDIVHGTALPANDVNMIHIVHEPEPERRQLCSGVAVTDSAILTAGHCKFQPTSPATVSWWTPNLSPCIIVR